MRVADRWERLAEEIMALGGRRRVSLAELCRQTGIPRTNLYRRFRGRPPWTRDELNKVAKVLEVDVDDLLRMADIDPATAWEARVPRLAPNRGSP